MNSVVRRIRFGTPLFHLMVVCCALGVARAGSPAPSSSRERELPVPAGHVRLTPAELKKLQSQKEDITLQLIAARDAERRAAKGAKVARSSDSARALHEKKMNELRDIEEQLRSGIRPDTK